MREKERGRERGKKYRKKRKKNSKENAPFAGNARSTQRISSTTFRGKGSLTRLSSPWDPPCPNRVCLFRYTRQARDVFREATCS